LNISGISAPPPAEETRHGTEGECGHGERSDGGDDERGADRQPFRFEKRQLLDDADRGGDEEQREVTQQLQRRRLDRLAERTRDGDRQGEQDEADHRPGIVSASPRATVSPMSWKTSRR